MSTYPTHTTPLAFDSYIARLSSLPQWEVCRVNEHGVVVHECWLGGIALVSRLVISRSDLRGDVDAVSAEIMHFGRMAAQCKRVWQVREREYRVWRSFLELNLRKEHEKEKLKPPTEALVEMTYRTHPEYGAWNNLVEAAEEAFNATEIVRDAFKAKAQLLKADVYRAPDGSLQRLSP